MKCDSFIDGFSLRPESVIEAQMLRSIENLPGKLHRSVTSGKDANDFEVVFKTMNQAIPQYIVDKFKSQAVGMKFFGHPVESLTRDELLAALGAAQSQEQDKDARRNRHVEMLEFLNNRPR